MKFRKERKFGLRIKPPGKEGLFYVILFSGPHEGAVI